MKQFYFLIITLLLLTATPAQSQEKVMQVHSGGSVAYEIPTAQVDSVTFDDDFGYLEYFIGAWESYPETGILMTLIIDSDQVYVSSLPQNIRSTCDYMLYDGQQYLLRRDSMYLIEPKRANPIAWDCGFKITKLFPDCIKLEYFGFMPMSICVKAIFLFYRKISPEK